MSFPPPQADLNFLMIQYVENAFQQNDENPESNVPRTPLRIRRPSTKFLTRAPKKMKTSRQDSLPPPIPFDLDDALLEALNW
jgi:hypothetical protein